MNTFNTFLAVLHGLVPTLMPFAYAGWCAIAWARGDRSADRMGRLMILWFLVNIFVHSHGSIAFFMADELANVAAHPDTYLGFHPDYCELDTRYCAKDHFVMAAQGFMGVVGVPFCAVAAWGLWRRKSWALTIAVAVCAVQLSTAVMFFAEPFIHETNPIVRDDPATFWGGYLMNGAWILFPLLGLAYYTRTAIRLSDVRPA